MLKKSTKDIYVIEPYRGECGQCCSTNSATGANKCTKESENPKNTVCK